MVASGLSAVRLGALGGPETFAGQAAARFASLGPLRYFPSTRDEWAALADGSIDAFVMLAESSRTGFAELAIRAASPSFGFYVAGEAQVPYGCLLLAAPGTALSDVRVVLGHGSVAQCRPWLAQHLPDAGVVVEDTSSLAAAKKVSSGDGTLALVGTAATAASFGLEVLARDVDGGVVGNYWLISREPRFSPRPTVVLVSGRYCSGEGCATDATFGERLAASCASPLGTAIGSLAASGYALRSVLAVPTGERLFQYDHLLAFTGHGELPNVTRLGLRLVGAFSDIIAGRDGNSS
ncbi:MAG: prephenate dehydratase domain-containing protein [Chloroflexota bacterium]